MSLSGKVSVVDPRMEMRSFDQPRFYAGRGVWSVHMRSVNRMIQPTDNPAHGYQDVKLGLEPLREGIDRQPEAATFPLDAQRNRPPQLPGTLSRLPFGNAENLFWRGQEIVNLRPGISVGHSIAL